MGLNQNSNLLQCQWTNSNWIIKTTLHSHSEQYECQPCSHYM